MTSNKTDVGSPNWCAINAIELYDDTVGYDEETTVKVASGLCDEEAARARVLYNLFNELWGVCIVVGDPGTGKDLFGNYLSFNLKRYFPWKRIMRDTKPRPLFGAYGGLFNEEVLAEDLAKMRTIAGSSVVAKTKMDEAAADWATSGRGSVLLQTSVLFLEEYWRYCYSRDPMNPMNITMGGVHKMKRHLDCLVIGSVQLPSELDKKTCLPWVDWRVTCTRSRTNKSGFTYFVEKVKYDKRMDILIPVSRRPFPISFDAGAPRSFIGDGKIRVTKPNYRPATEEERIVLTVLKAGVDDYAELINVLETEGDMEEWEVLATLKELQFNKRKRVVSYPCYFRIYNSKNTPNIQTRLQASE